MGDILIRNVDEHVVRRLKRKAEVNGTSLQTEARRALAVGSPLSAEERCRIFAELDGAWGDRPKLVIESAQIIREAREESEW